jgi:hypothetical protein
MDEYAKNRKKFNTKFRRLTAKDYESLTPVQKRRYDAIKERKNIPAIYDVGGGVLKNLNKGISEFDSDTFQRVIKPIINKRDFNAKQERAAKFRNYDTDLGFPLPKPARKTAPSETKATGGRVHRGRQASGSAEK